ncbi:MAG: flagellar hook-associated protein 2 [Eubacteriales bacterium]
MDSLFSVNSTLRISGLASGIDTDSIMSKLMSAQRVPVDRLNQDRQILQWQQEDYREINISLRSFRDLVFNMKLQATYLAKKATSSNESVVKVSANSNAVAGVYTLTVNKLAKGAYMTSTADLAAYKDTLNAQFGISGTYGLKINGTEITVDANTESINALASKINSMNLGVKASYDSTVNRFFLMSTTTGSASNFTVDPPSTVGVNSIVGTLNLTGGSTTNPGAGIGSGQNSEIVLNGQTLTGWTTNTFTINGVTFNLQSEGVTATAAITVSNDTDAVFNSIKGFITSYNENIDKINSKLSETRYRDYLPLTDEQRDKLSDDQIKKWEEKARSGLLRNDTLLEGIIYKMRITMSAVVPGLTGGQGYDNLTKIGISTAYYGEKGKLYIDETKLKDALMKDPDGVMNLFTKSSDVYSEKGIALRLYDDANNGMSLISDKAGSDSTFSLVDNSTIGKRLTQINDNINEMELRLKEVEDRYWRQFSAMEKAIQQMNAQSAWLAQQFGG